jgi:hypothetical protein
MLLEFAQLFMEALNQIIPDVVSSSVDGCCYRFFFLFSSNKRALLLQSELDLMFHLDKASLLLEEIIVNGQIVEHNVSKLVESVRNQCKI